VDWIQLTEDMLQWQVVAYITKNLLFHRSKDLLDHLGRYKLPNEDPALSSPMLGYVVLLQLWRLYKI
jgi:hypothetical protein